MIDPVPVELTVRLPVLGVGQPGWVMFIGMGREGLLSFIAIIILVDVPHIGCFARIRHWPGGTLEKIPVVLDSKRLKFNASRS